jgi:methylated-DNA-[protein]-cysteine S-methyltransferase
MIRRPPRSTQPTTLFPYTTLFRSYFDGRRKRFDLPLRPKGSAFQCDVWDALTRIPYGETMTYGEIADALRGIARSVGTACGANPIPIIVPCHRVVASSGKLGGFSGFGGVATKRKLLALEDAHNQVKRQPSLFDPPLRLCWRDASLA